MNFRIYSKLKLFCNVRGDFEMTDYIKFLRNHKHRSAMTKIRMSAHKYPIETGRYQKTKRDDRYCPLCCIDIGNEEHYLFDCPHPFIERVCAPLESRLQIFNPSLNSMNNQDKMKLLLNNSNKETVELFSKLCFKLQEAFQELTY